MMWTGYALVAAGGAIGSVLRAAGSSWALRLTGAAFPWGTIAINVLGSFVIGLASAALGSAMRGGAAEARAFVMVGICGGFTTFSSFSLQTVELLRNGRTAAACGNVALSVAACTGATLVGLAAGAAFRR